MTLKHEIDQEDHSYIIKLADGTYFVTKVVTGTLIQKEEGKPLIAVVSDEVLDRQGDIIHQGPNDKGRGWLLDDFNNKPRVYWMHDPFRPNLAISKAWVKDGPPQLLHQPMFDMEDPFAAELDRKYRKEFLSEWSVGYKGIISKPREEGSWGREFFEQELREISAVNRGANPNTATIAKSLGLELSEIKQIDDQESSQIALLKAELKDYREEFEARIREIEAAVMRDKRKAEDEEAKKTTEILSALSTQMDTISEKIGVLQE